MGAWSALRSPHVVKLFGVVREGPNVVLLMEHKAGKQSHYLHTAYVVDTNYSCCHLNSRNRWNQLSAQTCTVHGTWVDWVQVQKNTDVISVEMRKWVFLGCSKWLLTLLKECLSKLHQTCDASSLPDKHWYTWHIFPLSLNAGFFTSHNPEEKINQMLSVGKYC